MAASDTSGAACASCARLRGFARALLAAADGARLVLLGGGCAAALLGAALTLGLQDVGEAQFGAALLSWAPAEAGCAT